MTNKEQAEQYYNKQLLLGQVKFEFTYDLLNYTISIKQNRDYNWTERDKDIIIPSFVSVIEKGAFEFNEIIEAVTFQNPDAIIKIDKDAFYNCKRLQRIKLPNNIKEIADLSFANCIILQDIEIPDNVKIIGKEAFYECKKLARVKLSQNIEEIRDSSFYNCETLKIIEIPNSLRVIGDRAFANCTNIEEVIVDRQKCSLIRVEGNAFIDYGRVENKCDLSEFNNR